MSEVTRILSQIESGDPSAAELLLPLVCLATYFAASNQETCHAISDIQTETRVHACRGTGGNRDHRHPRGAPFTGGASRAGSGAADVVPKQPEADWNSPACVSRQSRSIPTGPFARPSFNPEQLRAATATRRQVLLQLDESNSPANRAAKRL